MHGPLVSILLPARDAASTIDACLRSISRQSLSDWECLALDDGSSDRTAELAEAWARRDRRYRVLRLARRGLVETLNDGLAGCRGELVARMDADDLMHRDRLAEQVAVLRRRGDLAGVGCHVRLFPRQGLTPRRRAYEDWLNGLRGADDVRRDAFVECPVAHPALVVRREVLTAFGYRDAGWPEDYDLVLRLLEAGHGIGVVPRRLVLWRDGPTRLSRTDPRYALDRFTACKAHFLARGFLARASTYVLWGYGATGRALRHALANHARLPSHIIEVAPGRIGQRIHGAPVVPVESLPALRGAPIVVSVAFEAPRRQIREVLSRLRFEEGRDFVCAA
jgi:glycosyltransferase involved in cell wall biosynthesis